MWYYRVSIISDKQKLIFMNSSVSWSGVSKRFGWETQNRDEDGSITEDEPSIRPMFLEILH